MLKTVLYVSLKTNPWPNDQPDLDAITEVARSRNAALDVTGALISTTRKFAQILEGPAEAVDAVMASILRDPRHHGVRVVRDHEIHHRLFTGWSLAYAGRASYVALHIIPLLDGGDELDVQRLHRCIVAFSRSL